MSMFLAMGAEDFGWGDEGLAVKYWSVPRIVGEKLVELGQWSMKIRLNRDRNSCRYHYHYLSPWSPDLDPPLFLLPQCCGVRVKGIARESIDPLERVRRNERSISANDSTVKRKPIDYSSARSCQDTVCKAYLTGTREAGTFKATSPSFETARHKSGSLPFNFAAS